VKGAKIRKIPQSAQEYETLIFEIFYIGGKFDGCPYWKIRFANVQKRLERLLIARENQAG
jgi:hypothetical protein